MSIIQTIREKGAIITIAAIGISLISFILMDSMSGTGKLFGGGDQTTVGIVNGDKIEYLQFNKEVKDLEQQYGSQASQNQLMQSAWDQMVAEKLVNEQFNKLGLVFTPKEMTSVIFSQDAPAQLKQAFTDPNTGQYNIEAVRQWWAQIKNTQNSDQKDAVLNQLIDPMIMNSLFAKYSSMIAGSFYQPKWIKDLNQEDNDQFATINYVAIPYSTIPDNSIKVTNEDIQHFIDSHKASFKQEAGMMLSYVTFSGAPSKADSQQVFKALTDLKPQFEADSNAKFFLGRNASVVQYFDGYLPGSKIQVPNKDAILALPKGGVFGPYLDGKNYVIAKMIDEKIMPDSFKVRHILLGTINPQTQQPLLPDSTAKRLADSIATAIQNGADFNTLEQKYSTDEAAKKTNGVMEFDLATVEGDNFAKEFGKFLLNDKGETKKVVKTEFGYHYIEILAKVHPSMAYKIAYMAREIDPSDATINKANGEAVKLSASAHNNLKAFNDYIKQHGLSRVDLPAPVKENDFQFGNYTDARTAIKWAFDNVEGSVSDPMSLGNDFVVVAIDKKLKAGTMDVQTARPFAEPLIKNIKKADEIKKKIGNSNTLESIAGIFKTTVLSSGEDSSLTFNTQIINGVGNEPRVAGAAFNKEYQSKISPAIQGNTGVFVIKVAHVGNKTATPDFIKQQLQMQHNAGVQQALQQAFQGLKNSAKIKDYRSKFF
ncbi:MAG: SurA N-terminal domain-containing protein [Chitinophagaceae bacterium]|nr:SurA N-terminal domain-containing protein [Chitinophagaceae bacterium]